MGAVRHAARACPEHRPIRARLCWAKASVRFLDPAIGTGSFFSALLEAFPAQSTSKSPPASSLTRSLPIQPPAFGESAASDHREGRFHATASAPANASISCLPTRLMSGIITCLRATKSASKRACAIATYLRYQRARRAVLLFSTPLSRLDGRRGAGGLADPFRIHGRELRSHPASLSHRTRDAFAHPSLLSHRRAIHRCARVFCRGGLSQIAPAAGPRCALLLRRPDRAARMRSAGAT